MISPTAISTAATNSLPSTMIDNTILDLQQQLAVLEDTIRPLRTTETKKLQKIENELESCNFLIDSGIGSKSDQAGLRKKKRQLRQRRIQLWAKLEVLPSLETEHAEISHQLNEYRRRHGVLDDESYLLVL